MKKICSGILLGGAVLALLSGCMGGLAVRAARSRDAEMEARFVAYSQLTGAEHGISVIEIENTLPTNEWFKITITENPELWKLYEIQAFGHTTLELGSIEYTLQLIDLESGQTASNAMTIPPGGANFVITDGIDIPFSIDFSE